MMRTALVLALCTACVAKDVSPALELAATRAALRATLEAPTSAAVEPDGRSILPSPALDLPPLAPIGNPEVGPLSTAPMRVDPPVAPQTAAQPTPAPAGLDVLLSAANPSSGGDLVVAIDKLTRSIDERRWQDHLEARLADKQVQIDRLGGGAGRGEDPRASSASLALSQRLDALETARAALAQEVADLRRAADAAATDLAGIRGSVETLTDTTAAAAAEATRQTTALREHVEAVDAFVRTRIDGMDAAEQRLAALIDAFEARSQADQAERRAGEERVEGLIAGVRTALQAQLAELAPGIARRQRQEARAERKAARRAPPAEPTPTPAPAPETESEIEPEQATPTAPEPAPPEADVELGIPNPTPPED